MSSGPGGVQPSGPPALPLVGHSPAFIRDKLGFLARCFAEHGDVVRLRIGGPTYLVTHPEDVKHVLVSSADRYEKTERLTGAHGRRFFGSGLVTAVGAAHLRQRRMMQPVFHRKVIDRFASVIAEYAEAMLGEWRDGAVLDVHEEMLGVTQRITARALLGAEDDAVLERFRNAASARRRYQEHLLGSAGPLAGRLPVRVRGEYARAHRETDDIVDAGIARRRAEPAPSGDLLSMLVHATYDDGTGMSAEQIRDEVRTLSVGGYETVAEALTWAWYLLAGAPEDEAAVWREVDAVVNRGGAIGLAELATLPWCRMVLAESMRLYPPTWLFVRVAQRDDVLPSGAAVAAGTKIYLSQWVMHRNPRHFPQPDRFDPRRFSPEAISARPRFTYLPFGAGRRLCIGEDFAWMQGISIMASVARRFRLALVAGETVVPEANVTLRPRGGLHMRLAAR
jgi:cytochrome P450